MTLSALLQQAGNPAFLFAWPPLPMTPGNLLLTLEYLPYFVYFIFIAHTVLGQCDCAQ